MRTLLIACCVIGLLASAIADAQTAMRLRGTITAIDGNTMTVKSRDGKEIGRAHV